MSNQITLTGDEAEERTKPNTYVVCDETGEKLLRSERHNHPHSTTPLSEWLENQEEEQEESPYHDDFDADSEVGKWFDITLSYTVDYRFRVPAMNDHQAEEVAKDWQFNATPADKYHVHTEKREVKTIERQDASDDWDPYGNTRLHEVLGDDE